MPETKKIYLTQEGLDDLKKELEYLKVEKRPEVINALKEARALGDLSENAEYDAARTEQAEVENKIAEIEKMLEHAEIISDINTGKVSIGAKVTIKYVEDDEEDEYTIVGSKEADPFNNRISNESPLAKGIMGARVGDECVVESPNGSYRVEIIEIM